MLNKLSEEDMRILHILVYLNCNYPSLNDLREFSLLDLFRVQINGDDLRLKILQSQAQLRYCEIMADSSKQEFIKTYEKIQNEYKDYRSIIAAFMTACGFMENEKYLLELNRRLN